MMETAVDVSPVSFFLWTPQHIPGGFPDPNGGFIPRPRCVQVKGAAEEDRDEIWATLGANKPSPHGIQNSAPWDDLEPVLNCQLLNHGLNPTRDLEHPLSCISVLAWPTGRCTSKRLDLLSRNWDPSKCMLAAWAFTKPVTTAIWRNTSRESQ